jgi:integrase
LFSSIASKSVANQTKAHVSALFNWAVKEAIVTANPAKLIDSHQTHDRERVLSASELPTAWQALGELDDSVTAAALKVILLTGQRPGEVAHMRREHIKDGWWEMPGAPVPGIWPGTKNGRSHHIWLAKSVWSLLGSSDATIGYVFAGSRGKAAVQRLDRAMREISNKLGGEKVTPHDLRRTFSTMVTGLGFGRDGMNRVTNHKEGGIADIYDRHDYNLENHRIMEAVAERIMGLVTGRASDNVVKFGR